MSKVDATRAENERLREELADARMHLGIIGPMLTPEQGDRWRDRANRLRAEAAAARIRGDDS